MIITTIDSNGEPLNIITLPDAEHLEHNIPEGGTYFEGTPPDNSYYVEGAWVTKPDQPTNRHRWDAVNKLWSDPRTLEQVKDAQWETIKVARQVANESVLLTPYGQFDATPNAQKSITDAVLMLQTLASIGTPTTIDFTLADNSEVTLTTEQMVTVGLMLGQRTQTVYAQARVLRIAIDNATTSAEVQAITWS